MLYFPLAFAQEYFTLITCGQSLVHQVLESARQSIYVQSHLSHFSDNVNLFVFRSRIFALKFPNRYNNPGKIFAKSPFSR